MFRICQIPYNQDIFTTQRNPDVRKRSSKEKSTRASNRSHRKTVWRGIYYDARPSIRLREIPVIKTGAPSLDLALGINGIPRGRIVEIFGPESSGKSTLAMHVVANAQKEGGVAVYIDAEHALDPGYAAKIGINLDDLIICQPDSGEEALNIAETLARSNAIDVIVIDSVAALVPKAS